MVLQFQYVITQICSVDLCQLHTGCSATDIKKFKVVLKNKCIFGFVL